MKKIMITETQLKKITESLILEQTSNINIEGRIGEIYEDGTISLANKSGAKIRIRLKTSNLGDVNIVKFQKNEDGDYQILTKKGLNKDFPLDKVKLLINFIDSPKTVSPAIDSSFATGKLTAHKV